MLKIHTKIIYLDVFILILLIHSKELEKELKEEKIKKMTMRDRLARAEGQVKIESDRATLLESALDQARLQIRALERTVQQQHEQVT